MRQGFPSAIVLAIAIAPALRSWWAFHQLARRIDDPLLPERMQEVQRGNFAALGFAFAIIAITRGSALVWAIPVMVAGMFASGYPFRCALYRETWSLPAYLWFSARMVFVWFGFWALLGATPWLASAAETRDLLAGAGLAAVLLVWNARFHDVFLFCLGSRPLEDGRLLERCRELAARCNLPNVRFHRLDLRGGVVANAVALPATCRPTVLFSSTIVERLTEDEVVAICAHELGHLEHYNPQRIRRLALVNYGLIALAAAWSPMTRTLGVSELLAALAWCALVFTAVLLRALDKQRQETAADLRAVELTGNAEAVATALTNLYAIARIPRRIDSTREQSDTHPSLARRIRDIRKAAGQSPAPLEAAVTFTSTDGTLTLTFERDGVRWVEAGSVTSTVAYAGLAELRIDARGTRAPRIVAVAGSARRFELPLSTDDVARAQAVLDRVDAGLGNPLPPRSIPLPLGRAAIAVAMALAFTVGQLAVGFVALLALLKPARPLLIGAAAAAFTAGAVVLRGAPFAGAWAICVAMLMAVAGLGLLLAARIHRHDAASNMRPALAAMAATAAIAFAALTMNGIDVVRLHQSARSSTVAPVMLVSVAAALAFAGTRRSRIVGLTAAVAGVVTVAAASPVFLDAVARDPFVVDAPPVVWTHVGSNARHEFEVPPSVSRLAFSRDGAHIALLQELGEDDRATFLIGPADGTTLTVLSAVDVAFLGSGHIVTIGEDGGGTTIKQIALSALTDVVWQQRLGGLHGAALALDETTGRWEVTGHDRTSVMRATGVVGVSAVERHSWPAGKPQRGYISAITTEGSHALVVEARFDRGLLEGLPPTWVWTWPLQRSYNQESALAILDGKGRREIGVSRLGSQCYARVSPQHDLVCAAFDGTRTRFVGVDAGTGAIAPIASIDGQFAGNENSAGGWLTGWAGARPVAINLATRQAFRAPAIDRYVSSIAVAGDRLIAVTDTTARVYALR